MSFYERNEGIEYLHGIGIADIETIKKYSDKEIWQKINNHYPGGYEEYILDYFD